MGKPLSEEALKLDTEEFNGICYSYRSWPAHDLQGVMDRYNELLEYVAKLMKS